MTVHIGDCLDVMRTMPAHSINLIVTSPPYAERRAHTYGGIPAHEYVAWFIPRAQEMARLLTPDGSLVINIKEGTQDGVRQTYVYDLILALVAHGWRWIDEYCWHKKNAMPGKWPTRFRDAWERIYHLAPSTGLKLRQDAVMRPTNPATLARDQRAQRSNAVTKLNATGSGLTNPSGKARANRHQPKMRQDAVKVPTAASTITRNEQARQSGEDQLGRRPTSTGSGFGKNFANFTQQLPPKMNKEAVMVPTKETSLVVRANTVRRGEPTTTSGTGSGLSVNIKHAAKRQPQTDDAPHDRIMSYPDNVLYGGTANHAYGHSAVYPEWLPEWFITLLTDEGDTVLDPFLGSGTTVRVAERLGRNGIGIEINPNTNIVTHQPHQTERML